MKKSNKKTYIYFLSDPTFISKNYYVGKTNSPKTRLSQHIKPSALKKKTHRTNWIKSLLKRNVRPLLTVICEVPTDAWQDAEKSWIAFLKWCQVELVNGNDGGLGNSGYKYSASTKKKIAEKKTIHGGFYTKEYKSWSTIKAQCNNPNDKAYKDYGGRGIKVCKKWNESFVDFRKDLGPCPKGYVLMLIDRDKDYMPGNVKWATRKECQRNKRNAILLTYNNQTKCLQEWAEILQLNSTTITRRLQRGWPIEKVMNK